jgi:hypothetical protein
MEAETEIRRKYPENAKALCAYDISKRLIILGRSIELLFEEELHLKNYYYSCFSKRNDNTLRVQYHAECFKCREVVFKAQSSEFRIWSSGSRTVMSLSL